VNAKKVVIGVRRTGAGPDWIAFIGRVGDRIIIDGCQPMAPGGRLQGPRRHALPGLETDDPDCDGRSQKTVCRLRAVLRIPDEYQRVKPDKKWMWARFLVDKAG
jgi:hypothetical protein